MPDQLAVQYNPQISSRDLRIDFLRGLVMVGLVLVHLEFSSILSMFAWGRVGLISTAEGFVALSGIVIGMVYGKKMDKDGFMPAAKKLWRRSLQLYRVNLFVIFSIALLYLIPFINTYEVMTWTAVTGGKTEWLYPDPSSTFINWIIQPLLLQNGPHQFQIIGLYVLLVGLAPGALFMMKKGYTWLLLLISITLYLCYTVHPVRLTGTRFEYGFPILAWQLLFFSGMTLGVHRQAIGSYLTRKHRQILLIIATAGSLFFLFLTSNNPSPVFWPGKLMSFIPADQFHWLYNVYFLKTPLGIGRLINNFFLYILAYFLLTRYWHFFNKIIGWFLIPVGQASLYVFIIHVYLILIISNTPLLNYDNFWINSAIHISVLGLIWWMVTNKFAFRWIPR